MMKKLNIFFVVVMFLMTALSGFGRGAEPWSVTGTYAEEAELAAGEFFGGSTCLDYADCDHSNLCLDEFCVGGVCTAKVTVCDDDNPCNGVETCNPATGCVAGTPLVCNDGNACNGIETCDPLSGCIVSPVPLPCDDGNACNGVETCDPAIGCVAGTPLACDDGNFCNGQETCNPSTGCVVGIPPVCDDGDACNGVETCDRLSGCVGGFPPVCDDGDACNGVETCDPATGCVAGTPLVCNDNNACNGVETCDPATGCVAGTPLTCDDGEACNGVETCDPAIGCVNGTPMNCDDGNPCTDDACANSVCINTPHVDADADGFRPCDGDCNDGNAAIFPGAREVCNGVDDDCDGLIDETTFAISSTTHSDVLCNGPGGSARIVVTGGVLPYRYLWSTGATTHQINQLVPGVYSVTATDSLGCQVTAAFTISHNPLVITQSQSNVTSTGGSDGSATATPSGGTPPYRYKWSTSPPRMTATITGLTAGIYVVTVNDRGGCSATASYTITQPVPCPPAGCDDGDACNGLEICDPILGCIGGTPLTCDDGDACNGVETCNPSTGCVAGTPLTCDDGDVCNGVETCDPATGCVAGTPLTCDDGDACNGLETCSPLAGCAPGTPPVCDDGDACNGVETCDPATGCVPGISLCDDGNACNGVETCDPTLGCIAGTPPVCDDNDPCNGVETCDPATGCVAGTPMVCDDGNACNGLETCDATLGCIAGTPPVCDDGNVCNGVETCDRLLGCVAGFPPVCDDGEACNGLETCDPVLGCVAGTPMNCDDGDPCTDDSCSNGVCINTPHVDADGDRFRPCDGDCDDNNADIYPGADELCNGVDDNCNGTIDETTFALSSITHDDVPCRGPGGTAKVTVSGGTNPYKYLWSNGGTTAQINQLTAGVYSVTVTDKGGCEVTASATVLSIQIIITQSQTNVTTFGGSNGTATATPSGGTSPYRYRWSTQPPRMTATITGLTAGTYTVTVTDHGGCTATASYIITQPAFKTDETGEERNFMLQAYPNPFNDKLNIGFSLPQDSRVKLEVFNVAGQKLASLFEGDVKAYELQRFEFSPNTICDCMIVYRLQTEQGTYYGKAVMVK